MGRARAQASGTWTLLSSVKEQSELTSETPTIDVVRVLLSKWPHPTLDGQAVAIAIVRTEVATSDA
eukprot:12220531-Alexandrium_andersonii.AAC.1